MSKNIFDAGSVGFRGYDDQIIATVWVALDLFLAQQHSTKIFIDPKPEGLSG
jgi:hypothetical protein